MDKVTSVLLVIGLFIWVMAWVFLPFAVFGIKRRLDTIIKLLKELSKIDKTEDSKDLNRDAKPEAPSTSKSVKPKDVEDMSIKEISKRIRNGTLKEEKGEKGKGETKAPWEGKKLSW